MLEIFLQERVAQYFVQSIKDVKFPFRPPITSSIPLTFPLRLLALEFGNLQFIAFYLKLLDLEICWTRWQKSPAGRQK